MELWTALDEGTRVLIQVATALTIVSGLYVAARKAVRQYAWLVSDKIDHEELRTKLDHISRELTSNGGSTVKDVLNRVAETQEYQGAYLKTLLHTNEKPMFEMSPTGQITNINRAFARATGFTPEELLENEYINAVDPSYRELAQARIQDAVAASRDFNEEFLMRRPGGELFLGLWHAHTIKTTSGQLLGYVGEMNVPRS